MVWVSLEVSSMWCGYPPPSTQNTLLVSMDVCLLSTVVVSDHSQLTLFKQSLPTGWIRCETNATSLFVFGLTILALFFSFEFSFEPFRAQVHHRPLGRSPSLFTYCGAFWWIKLLILTWDLPDHRTLARKPLHHFKAWLVKWNWQLVKHILVHSQIHTALIC